MPTHAQEKPRRTVVVTRNVPSSSDAFLTAHPVLSSRPHAHFPGALSVQLVVLTPYLAQLRELREALDGELSHQDAAELSAAMNGSEDDGSSVDECDEGKKGGVKGGKGGAGRVGGKQTGKAAKGPFPNRESSSQGSLENRAKIRVATGESLFGSFNMCIHGRIRH